MKFGLKDGLGEAKISHHQESSLNHIKNCQ